jgi:hypothetical protein
MNWRSLRFIENVEVAAQEADTRTALSICLLLSVAYKLKKKSGGHVCPSLCDLASAPVSLNKLSSNSVWKPVIKSYGTIPIFSHIDL